MRANGRARPDASQGCGAGSQDGHGRGGRVGNGVRVGVGFGWIVGSGVGARVTDGEALALGAGSMVGSAVGLGLGLRPASAGLPPGVPAGSGVAVVRGVGLGKGVLTLTGGGVGPGVADGRGRGRGVTAGAAGGAAAAGVASGVAVEESGAITGDSVARGGDVTLAISPVGLGDAPGPGPGETAPPGVPVGMAGAVGPTLPVSPAAGPLGATDDAPLEGVAGTDVCEVTAPATAPVGRGVPMVRTASRSGTAPTMPTVTSARRMAVPRSRRCEVSGGGATVKPAGSSGGGASMASRSCRSRSARRAAR